MHLIQTVVQVTGLEVMRLTRDLDSGHVVEVGVREGELSTLGLEAGGFTIVENDNSEAVTGVVEVAGGTDGIHDEVVVLTTAGNEGVDGGHVVACQPQLGTLPLLHGPHGPGVVHQRGDGDGNLDGDKDPSGGIYLSGSILCPYHAGDSQDEVGHVQARVSKGQDGHQLEDPALPSLPNVRVIPLVNLLDGALIYRKVL